MRSDEVEVLFELFDHQIGLGLDQQVDAHRFGHLDAGHQLVMEHPLRLGPRARRLEPAAGLGGDRRRAQLGGQPQGPLGVLAADGPVVRIGVDPAGIPVGLPRVGHGVHHEGVDVGDRQPMARQRVADRGLAFFQQPGRPGVGHVGQDFNARVTQAGDFFDRVFDRKVHVGVGTEGQLHGVGERWGGYRGGVARSRIVHGPRRDRNGIGDAGHATGDRPSFRWMLLPRALPSGAWGGQASRLRRQA